MTNLTTAPASLRKPLHQLERALRRGRLDASGVDALAEAYFRLATHRQTKSSDAIRLLRLAHRIDGANPKYAYFLARVYFRLGDFDRAAKWLTTAVRLCPTSHRLWTHVALLQRELNKRYRGSDHYEPDGLRRVSDSIFDRVRSGRDEWPGHLLRFRPASSTATGAAEPAEVSEAPPERRNRADHCRWSGVYDLLIEDSLEGEPSSLALTRMHPWLRHAARVADTRPGGVSAFAIAAVQWAVAGYPTETVRRLRRLLPRDLVRPSLAVLDLVCDVLDAETSSVAPMLAEALAARRLTPTLAALLHHRRLLCQPVESSVVTKHRAGRRFLTSTRRPSSQLDTARQDERATALVASLRDATTSLEPRARRVPQDDWSATPIEPLNLSEANAALTALEGRVARLHDLNDAAETLMNQSPLTRDTGSTMARLLEEAAEANSVELDDLLIRSWFTDAGEAVHPFRARAAACRSALNGLLYIAPFGSRLRADDAHPPADPVESQSLQDVTSGLRELIADTSKSRTEGPGPTERLARVEADATELTTRLDADWIKLAGHVAAQRSGSLTAEALEEYADIADFVQTIDTRAATGLSEISELRSCSPPLPPSDVERLEKVERMWRRLATEPGRFRRKLQHLPQPAREETQSAPQTTSNEAPQAADDAEPSPTPGTKTGAVEQALAALERQVDRRFKEAVESFSAYNTSQQQLPGLRALRWSVRERHAEALFRLGKRAEAHTAWNGLLCDDRFDAAVLRNVAVCVSGGAEIGRELPAWRALAEMLYYQDVIADTPQIHAKERAALHRHFGAAYFPPFLAPDADKKPDTGAIVAFFASPTRARTIVEHKLLEWFNTRLMSVSPPVVLGCRRDEGAKARAAAQQKMQAFSTYCCDLLPARVRPRFNASARRRLTQAAEACEHAKRLTADADPTYADEADKYVEWVRDVCRFKIHLYNTLKDCPEIVRNMASMTMLETLLQLDRVPIDLSEPVLGLVARELKGSNPESLRNLMGMLRDCVLTHLYEFLRLESNDRAEREWQDRQIRRLTDVWCKSPAITADPMHLMHLLLELAKQAAARTDVTRAVTFALAAIRLDDHRAGVVQNALACITKAAQAARQTADHRLIADTVRAWTLRARERLDRLTTNGSETTDDAERQTAVADIDLVAETFRQHVVQLFVAPFGEFKHTTDWHAVRGALELVILDYPDTRAVRTVALCNLASAAAEAGRRDLGLAWFHDALKDAEAIAVDPDASTQDRAQAVELRQKLKQMLAGTHASN